MMFCDGSRPHAYHCMTYHRTIEQRLFPELRVRAIVQVGETSNTKTLTYWVTVSDEPRDEGTYAGISAYADKSAIG